MFTAGLDSQLAHETLRVEELVSAIASRHGIRA